MEILVSETLPSAIGLHVHENSEPNFTRWNEGPNRE